MNQRVVVTGMGCLTGFGAGWRVTWEALISGRSCIRPWTLAEAPEFPVRYAAPVSESILADAVAKHAFDSGWACHDRRTRLGLAAALDALSDAGFNSVAVRQLSQLGKRVGVVVGSGAPERDTVDILHAVSAEGPSLARLVARRDQLRCDRALRQTSDALAVALARRIGASAGAMNLTTACAAAAQAIGTAFRMVRRGELDLAIAGGADSVLNLPTMLGLHLLGAPSVDTRFGDRLCRPFDADRSGLVAGEGAGMVVLESLSSAQARGATIYGEVLGFGTSLDAYQVTAPHPQGEGAATAMNRALADARLTPNAISHINAHGTSTPLNDPSETLAIKRVFAAGEHWRSLTVSANKSAFGHLIAAAGGPEFIATVLTVRHGMAPPTLNLERPDPACDLDYVPGIARRAPVTAALSNSFGFGGLNAVLAIGAWHHE